MICLWALNPAIAQREDNEYLAGAVPEVNGKIIFSETIHIPNADKQTIYNKMEKWMDTQFNTETSRTVYKDYDSGNLVALGNDTIVFKSTFLSLDRAIMTYQFLAEIKDGECSLSVDKISYSYGDNERYSGEEMISDKVALNKSKTKVIKGLSKWRLKTVDFIDELFNSATKSLYEIAPQQNIQTSATNRIEQREVIAATPLIPATRVSEKEQSTYPSITLPTTSVSTKAEIDLPANLIDLLQNQIVTVALIKGDQKVQVPIHSIEAGITFNKPSLSLFVPFGSDLYDALESNNTFVVNIFNKDDATKDKAAITIECRKMLSQSITPESFTDSNLKKELGANALQKLYIGEIIQAWTK